MAALFTSESRIVEVFAPGAGFIRAPGQALLEIVATTGAFLNPGSPYRVHWDPAGIAGVLGRPFTRTITKPTQLLLATPSAPPNELISELRVVLGSRADVSDAWLALAQWPENGEFSWYLDVRTNFQRAYVAGYDVGGLQGRSVRRASAGYDRPRAGRRRRRWNRVAPGTVH